MKSLAEVLPRSLRGTDPQRARELRLKGCWAEVAGPMLASRSAVRAEGGRVIVEVAEVRWANEIKALRDVLRDRLDAVLGGVSDVGVRVMPPGWRPPQAPPRESRPSAATTAASGPPPEPPAAVSRALDRISDDDLRQRMARAAAAYLAHPKVRPGATERGDDE